MKSTGATSSELLGGLGLASVAEGAGSSSFRPTSASVSPLNKHKPDPGIDSRVREGKE